MNNIYLVGFMGTGKTAVGKELSKRLNLDFVDIDKMIVEREKRSINDIFASSGEQYFRKIEKEILEETANQKAKVVSCGGGIVLNYDNIALMKQTGSLIALSARIDVILQRTKNNNKRPLLNAANPKEKIAELLEFRKPYYSKADFIIDTSDLSVGQVVEKILAVVG